MGCGSRVGRRNRALVTEQRIEEAALSGIGRASQHDPRQWLLERTSDRRRMQCAEIRDDRLESVSERDTADRHHVFLIREVDARLDECKQRRHAITFGVDRLPRFALLPALAWRR